MADGVNASGVPLGRRVLSLMGPIMLASVMGQTIAQTDLWVVSRLGEEAVAAAALPGRLLLVDSLTAMAMGPVVGLLVAGAATAHARRRAVQGGLAGATLLGAVIGALGLVLMPWVADALIAAPAVRDHAESALFWLLVATPFRLAQFVGAMVLFALRRGRPLLRLYAAAVVLNAALDVWFVYGLGLGFSGVYASTCAIAVLEWVATLWLLRDHLAVRTRAAEILRWLRQAARNMATEWLNALSRFGFELVLVVLLAARAAWSGQLAGFSAGLVLVAAMLVPVGALANATGMVAAADETSAREWAALRRRFALVSSAVAGALLVAALGPGAWLYGLRGEAAHWLGALIACQAVALPFRVLAAVSEGRHKAAGRFGTVLRGRLVQEFALALPLFLVGLLLDSAVLACSGVALGCAVNEWLLHRSLPEREPPVPDQGAAAAVST